MPAKQPRRSRPSVPPQKYKKVRLVKVVVQPIMVLDDGDTIEEVPTEQIIIPASEWRTYSSDRFQREMQKFEKKVNEPPAPPVEE